MHSHNQYLLEHSVLPQQLWNLKPHSCPVRLLFLTLLTALQVEEFYVIVWEAKKEQIFEMPTGGAAMMRQGPNLLKLARKEQCLALLQQLRNKFRTDGQIHRVFPSEWLSSCIRGFVFVVWCQSCTSSDTLQSACFSSTQGAPGVTHSRVRAVGCWFKGAAPSLREDL